MPVYSYLGLAMLAISEAGMFARVEPFWSWHTAIAWTSYILLIDGFIYKKRGSSWLMNHRREFAFLWLMSIPLWVIFEGYNLLIRNWHYINLPENLAVRYLGYAWAFGTISPAIFETAELIAVAWKRPSPMGEGPSPIVGGRPLSRVGSEARPARSTADRQSLDSALIVAGAVMLVWPLIWPSPYQGALVFLGFIFLLDPINKRLGAESLLTDFRGYGPWPTQRLVNLLLSGLVCGILWEFWNYWSRAKWIYDVPIMQGWKIFEMPLLGYFGFSPFAVECFTMYVFVRRWLWHGPEKPVGL
jgi:hypothetical protein